MNKQKMYDVICIGNYTKDTIISPSGTTYVDGGAVNYAAHAAARLGLNVAVVTHLAKEDQRVVEKFEETGIDCFVTYTPHSTCMRLEYPTTNPDVRNLSVACTAGSISPNELHNIRASAAVIGSSLRGEVGLDVIRFLKDGGMLLAADVQGFVRVLQDKSLINQTWDEMPSVLAHLDILKSDAAEAEFLTGEADIYKAARHFANLGPREIVLTHKDGLLVFVGGQFLEAGFYPSRLNGRSGRGDTCIGTYVAMRLSKSPAEATIWAAAVTSLKMEKLGPFDRTAAELDQFIRKNYM